MKNDEVIPMDDPRWEDALKALGPEELIARSTTLSARTARSSACPGRAARISKGQPREVRSKRARVQHRRCRRPQSRSQLRTAADKYLANLDDDGKRATDSLGVIRANDKIH